MSRLEESMSAEDMDLVDVEARGLAAPVHPRTRHQPARFSLIFATKGRPHALREALESAARELPGDSELIVVDGDPQRSAENVVRRVQRWRHDTDITYVSALPGLTHQRNVGIDAARRDIVVFVDDDCTVEAGLFEVLAGVYRDPAVVGATGRIEGPLRDRVGNNPHSRMRWLLLGGGRQGSMSSFGFRCPIVDVEQSRDVEFMPGPFMSARREMAATVRFDEHLTGYCLGEDDDFAYRLSRRGRIRYEPSAVVHHHELGWEHRDRRQMDCLQVVNRTYLFRKNFAQTLRARARFTALLGMLCTHRVLNREWSGLLGLLDGMKQVRSGGSSVEFAHRGGVGLRSARSAAAIRRPPAPPSRDTARSSAPRRR
jgi:glycosyltransferase involved in cell wall biosynthesis